MLVIAITSFGTSGGKHTYIPVGRQAHDKQTELYILSYIHMGIFFATPPPPLASYWFHLVFMSYVLSSVRPSVCPYVILYYLKLFLSVYFWQYKYKLELMFVKHYAPQLPDS